MRDDLKNAVPKTEPGERRQALKFFFTPHDTPKPDASNPLAQTTTFVPDVVDALRGRFGDAVLSVETYANEHTVYVATGQIVDVCRFLKSEQGFVYLSDLGGVDRFTDEDRFEVYYNLVNFEQRQRIRITVRVDEENPVLPSVTPVYRAASWNEREAFDMLGLRFEGHPDLRRMYMPEDFEYSPLRKEFPQLGIPGSLPLPPRLPEGPLTMDPFAASHLGPTPHSYEEPASDLAQDEE